MKKTKIVKMQDNILSGNMKNGQIYANKNFNIYIINGTIKPEDNT